LNAALPCESLQQSYLGVSSEAHSLAPRKGARVGGLTASFACSAFALVGGMQYTL